MPLSQFAYVVMGACELMRRLSAVVPTRSVPSLVRRLVFMEDVYCAWDAASRSRWRALRGRSGGNRERGGGR
jgi:hypothetical protein